MNVMILAAGQGTRLKPFTLEKPKPCLPFFTVPLGYYSLSLLDGIKVDRLVANTHHLPDQVRELFGNVAPIWKNMNFTEEQPKLLGSGGGIHNAELDLRGKGSFLVMNGDEVILPHKLGMLQDMIDFHKWHKGIATLLTMEHPQVGKQFGGAWIKEKTEIAQFSKTAVPGTRGLHFLGVLLLEEDIFDYFKPEIDDENILYETLTKAIQAGEKVHAFETKAEWFETGNPQDFLHATETVLQAIKDNPYNENLAQPYWLDYLKQTIRLYSNSQFVIENNWPKLDELKAAVKQIKKGF